MQPTKDGTKPGDEPKLMASAIKEHLGYLGAITGVEIGCLNGRSAKTLLSAHSGLTLHSIDPFIPDSMAPKLIGSEAKARKLNKAFIDSGRLTIRVAYSWDVVKDYADGSLDLVFIDGDHTYKAVKKDLKDYGYRLRVGGLLFIHDCRMNRGGAHFHKGPSKLADEALFGKPKQWELIGEAFSLACFKKRSI